MWYSMIECYCLCLTKRIVIAPMKTSFMGVFLYSQFPRKETSMQEEVEHRSVTLAISAAKLTARTLKAAIIKYLAHVKAKKLEKSRASPVIPYGKQTVKELIGQNQGVSNIEVTDSNIKSFERVARKYGVDYAIKRDSSVSPPKWLVFFKARDADALTAAFTEFTAKTVKREERPSVLKTLEMFKDLLKDRVLSKTPKKELER